MRLLESVLDFGDKGTTTAFRFFDLGLTALVIGGGTKPVGCANSIARRARLSDRGVVPRTR
jgi:hypothetical protein